MKRVTVEVVAGLANRLRALVSAICLAEELNCSLHIVWSALEGECHARFQDLFEPIPGVRITTGPILGEYVTVLTETDLAHWKSHTPHLPIKSHGQFYTSHPERWSTHLRNLRPLPAILIRLETGLFAQCPIGVHIRRGDNTVSRQASPLDTFVDKMNTFPSDALFVVATDDEPTRESLSARFGTRVRFPATIRSRVNTRGVQDALLDFIALSKCSTILGSIGSSFSDVAAQYGGVPLVLVGTI